MVKRILVVLVLAVAISTIGFPKVRAQSTSISNLSFPTKAVLATSTVTVPVSFTVSYTNGLVGPTYGLWISIYDKDTVSYPQGSVISSNPDACRKATNFAQSTACYIVLENPTGSESVTFGIDLTSARTYHFVASTVFQTAAGQGVGSSISHMDFTISVTSGTQETTSSTSITNLQAPSTSITSLQAPSTATVGTDVMVTVGATYELGSAFAVSVGISEIGASNWTTGSATSSLAPCHAGQSSLAFCWYPTTKSGSDLFRFDLQFNSTKTYNLRVFLQLYDPTTHKVIPSATTTQDFSIAVSAVTTSQTMQVYTTSTPSLQMPQPPQQTGTQSTNNTQQLIITLAVVAAALIGAAFLYARRKQQPKVRKTRAKKAATRRAQPKVTNAEKVETDATHLSTKTAEGMRLCIKCGNELPPNLMYCDNCGTKQP